MKYTHTGLNAMVKARLRKWVVEVSLRLVEREQALADEAADQGKTADDKGAALRTNLGRMLRDLG